MEGAPTDMEGVVGPEQQEQQQQVEPQQQADKPSEGGSRVSPFTFQPTLILADLVNMVCGCVVGLGGWLVCRRIRWSGALRISSEERSDAFKARVPFLATRRAVNIKPPQTNHLPDRPWRPAQMHLIALKSACLLGGVCADARQPGAVFSTCVCDWTQPGL